MNLKFGVETGSLVNVVLASGAGTAPRVGDAATVLFWTDRHGATVVAVERQRQDSDGPGGPRDAE